MVAVTSRAKVVSIHTSGRAATTPSAATACAPLIRVAANCSGTCSACSTRTASVKSEARAALSSRVRAAFQVASRVAQTLVAARSFVTSIQPAARARGMKPAQRTPQTSARVRRIARTAAIHFSSTQRLAARMSSAALPSAKSSRTAANSVGTRTVSMSRKAFATPWVVALAVASAASLTHRPVAMIQPAATSFAASIRSAVPHVGM